MSDSSGTRYVLGRLAWAVGVVWVVLTATYVILASLPATRFVGLTPIEMGFAAVTESNAGPLAQYVQWMASFLTLDWGQSTFYDTSVVSLYADRIPITLAYVVPGLVGSLVLGTGVATYAAVKPDSLLDRALSAVSYTGLSLPAFVAAEALLIGVPTLLGWTYVPDRNIGFWHPRNLQRFALAAALIAFTFAAVQIRHVKSETTQYLSAEFVKTARSKGAGRLRLAVHVFRNTWPALVSVVLGEALGLLVLTTIVVEEVWGIQGVGVAVFNGFGAGDPMLSFTAVFGMVGLGVLGTLLRDTARALLDPRVS
ncbi:ABC transporter permease [Salarchaeum japonicum]|uniref:ABC transporter permease n=1 Tax=Salarchaeum japonicum TaxID=555573 RepID=UPI003C70A9DB